MVRHEDTIIEVTLQRHAPASLEFAFGEIFIGSGRVADDKDRGGLVGRECREHKQRRKR